MVSQETPKAELSPKLQNCCLSIWQRECDSAAHVHLCVCVCVCVVVSNSECPTLLSRDQLRCWRWHAKLSLPKSCPGIHQSPTSSQCQLRQERITRGGARVQVISVATILRRTHKDEERNYIYIYLEGKVSDSCNYTAKNITLYVQAESSVGLMVSNEKSKRCLSLIPWFLWQLVISCVTRHILIQGLDG